jgi:hypothetical protein
VRRAPAPRVDAGVAALNACYQRPDLYPRLKDDIDRLLDDPHPAPRLETTGHLIRIWDIDRAGFWSRLRRRLEQETNFGVLPFVLSILGRVLHADPGETESHLFEFLGRFDGTPNERRVYELAADLLAILSVTYSSARAQAALARLIAAPADHKGALQKILLSLRGAVALGLRPGEEENPNLRRRAQGVVHGIVLAANAPLEGYDQSVPLPDDQVAALRACIELLDTAGMELYFATGRAHGGEGGISEEGCSIFLQETAETIERIGDNASRPLRSPATPGKAEESRNSVRPRRQR